MSRRARDAQSGQASSEYAIVVGAIAVVCIVAAVFVGVAVKGQFGSTAEPIQGGPFEPPFPSTLTWPTTLEECQDDGWRNFAQFSDEGECVAYIDGLTP